MAASDLVATARDRVGNASRLFMQAAGKFRRNWQKLSSLDRVDVYIHRHAIITGKIIQ
jgi:hypothetical protein